MHRARTASLYVKGASSSTLIGNFNLFYKHEYLDILDAQIIATKINHYKRIVAIS